MAITIEDSPANILSPVYNDLIFVVSSDNTAEANFKFVFDVFVWDYDSVGYPATQNARIKLNTVPGTSSCVFDAAKIVAEYITHDVPVQTTGAFVEKNTQSGTKFKIQFGEEYGSSPQIYSNLDESDEIIVWNAIFDFEDFYDSGFGTSLYVLTASSSHKWLTTNFAQDIMTNQNAWLYFIQQTANQVSWVEVKTYNSAGALLDTYWINNAFKAYTNFTYSFLRASSGTNNLNEIDTSHFIAGSAPDSVIVTADVDYYTLQAFNSASAATSVLMRYNVVTDCGQFDNYRFHFLNKLGGWDAFNFNLLSNRAASIERKTYQKSTGSLNSAGNTWAVNKYDRGKVNYQTKIRDKVTVQSDWLSADECTWLEELITSPEVYLENSDNELIAVNIITDSYQRKQKYKLYALSFDFEYSYNRFRQRN